MTTTPIHPAAAADERGAFEKWADDKDIATDQSHPKGYYIDTRTSFAWEAWQARAALALAAPAGEPAPAHEIERLRGALSLFLDCRMFGDRFDHSGAMNATQISDRDLYLRIRSAGIAALGTSRCQDGKAALAAAAPAGEPPAALTDLTERLIEACNKSNESNYRTLSTSFVLELVRAALAPAGEPKEGK